MSKHSSVARLVKINPTNSRSNAGLGQTSGTAPARSTQAGPVANDSARAEQTDQMQISNLSRYLAGARSGSPAQEAKVIDLGAAVASGTYNVDSEAVSKGIIQHSLLFGGAW